VGSIKRVSETRRREEKEEGGNPILEGRSLNSGVAPITLLTDAGLDQGSEQRKKGLNACPDAEL